MASSNLRIGLYMGSWPQNIGNAFFDMGARAILRAAFPEAILYPMGGAVHWMFAASERHHEGRLLRKTREIIGNETPSRGHSFEIGQAAEVDLLVFAGMSMCKEFVISNGRTFIEASKRGVAALGLGAGASAYTKEEATIFSDFLNSLGRSAIITRDDDTFEMFSGRIKNVWSGIDCAFYLPDFYTAPTLALDPYDIENFDGTEQHPRIDHSGRRVFYTHHDLWGPLQKRYISKPNTLVSDVPEDYLTLYSQAVETHADRVHACVATLAYGNGARLYSNTLRKDLFRKVGVPEITESICKLVPTVLTSLKKKQVDQTRAYVEALIG